VCLARRVAWSTLCHNKDMNDSVHFEGDPGTDSARRHMERVLNAPEPAPRRWPWVVAALGGGGLWLLWHSGRTAARTREGSTGAAKAAPHT
jgi:hypothetical protein